MPTELRRKLELEAQPVWLDYYNGRINVSGKKVHEERMQRAMVELERQGEGAGEEGIEVIMYARSGHARASAWSIWRYDRTEFTWMRRRDLGGIRGQSRGG